jgi:hypothetical protein
MERINGLLLILTLILVPTCLVLSGCPSGDDDDSAGDDDDGPDPLAPVLTDIELEHGGGADNCKVYLQFHAEDADGDMGADDGSGEGVPVEIVTLFGTSETHWMYTLNAGEVMTWDFSLDYPVGGVLGQQDPYVDPDTEYDVEVYMYDIAGHESNHLIEEGYETPGTDCI